MRTSQKGFVAPLPLALVAVLLIGGAYVYIHNKQASQSAIVNPTTQTTQSTTTVMSVSASSGKVTLSTFPTSGKAPLTVKFSTPFSQFKDAPIVVFGDSSQSYMSCPRDGCVVSHTYTNAGTYTVRFMLGTNVAGTETITIAPQSSITVVSPNGGETYTDTIPVRWTSQNIKGNVNIFVYYVSRQLFSAIDVPNTGSKDIHLSDYYGLGHHSANVVYIKVCDKTNGTCDMSDQGFSFDVTVATPSANNSFSVSPISGRAPLTVTAKFLFGICDGVGYDLEWGDGTNIAMASNSYGGACNPIPPSATPVLQTHTYSKPGTYSVSLTGEDFVKKTGVSTKILTVTVAP